MKQEGVEQGEIVDAARKAIARLRPDMKAGIASASAGWRAALIEDVVRAVEPYRKGRGVDLALLKQIEATLENMRVVVDIEIRVDQTCYTISVTSLVLPSEAEA